MGYACTLVSQDEEMVFLSQAVLTLESAVRKMCISES